VEEPTTRIFIRPEYLMNLSNALKVLFITIGIGCLVFSFYLFTAVEPGRFPFPVTTFQIRIIGGFLIAAAVYLIIANRRFD
jgi:hypothetical protein